MCGIIGVTGRVNAAELILSGLQKLEYRGYDSAGIATTKGSGIDRRRAEGKIKNLSDILRKSPLDGSTAIGHTRWATHGAPVEKNAHPHATDKVAVVHNGIIENYLEVRRQLEAGGVRFTSDTDTEVIPQLITKYLSEGLSKKDAVMNAIKKLDGAYAIGVIFHDEEGLLFTARKGAPLVLGYGENEKYIASDALALANISNEISYLEEGDIAELTPNLVKIYDKNGNQVERKVNILNLSNVTIGKENYRHFMQKEIFEQPSVLGDNLHAYYNAITKTINFPKTNLDFSNIEKVTIVACGTSFYAGKVATYWIENIAGTRTEADIASEFRYRNSILPENGACVFISQSGETADTLAALRYAKSKGQKIISIVNTVESSIARESDLVLPIYSGPEIGVASTKAFTTQLCTLAYLALEIAKQKNPESQERIDRITASMMELPALISKALSKDSEIKRIANDLAKAQDILYIGRGVSFPIAMEGALKLKEISYIHSEAFAAGELKHGPIALVDENVPVIAIAPNDSLFEKTASNIREVASRGGKIILISDEKGLADLQDVVTHSIEMPSLTDDKGDYTYSILTPIFYVVPTQLLAYHTAVAKGTDIDQPRNLAKSVTVE